jgi:hypothetical protein
MSISTTDKILINVDLAGDKVLQRALSTGTICRLAARDGARR